MTLGPAPDLMVDWLTLDVPDPLGLPVNGGKIMRLSREGHVEWTTPAKLSVQGSWSSSMTFRAAGAEYVDDNAALIGLGNAKRFSGLEVSGNPAKFLTGHNLFGSDDPRALARAVIEKSRTVIWPDQTEHPELDLDGALVGRIDLTGSLLLDREGDVMPFLRALEENVFVPYRGRGVFDAGGTTLYFGRTAKGGRAKDWAWKLYWKGPEITAHPIPEPAYRVPGLLDEVNRTIRAELTLRTPELKRLGLRKVGQWTPAKVREIWEAKMAKLHLQKIVCNLDTVDFGSLGIKGRLVDALAAWRAGNDMRAGRSRETFYRLRRELLAETGFDIALPFPVSNVVPLRRPVSYAVASRPTWADDLTAALSSAA